MKRTFVQTSLFSKRLDEKDSETLLASIEEEILENPLVGDVIPGTAGVRKMRVNDPRRQKGKRGGLRVLFLDLPRRGLTYLLYLYGKNESEDISAEQKKQIVALVRIIKGD